MTVRMNRLPGIDPKPRKKPRAPQRHGRWRCEGAYGCGEILTSWAAAERHVDTAHANEFGGHGARLSYLLEDDGAR